MYIFRSELLEHLCSIGLCPHVGPDGSVAIYGDHRTVMAVPDMRGGWHLELGHSPRQIPTKCITAYALARSMRRRL